MRKKITALTLAFMLVFAAAAMATVETPEPAMEPEISENLIILDSVSGIPETLKVTLTIGTETIAVISGNQIIEARPFLEDRKTALKIDLNGSGVVNGAKFVFQPILGEFLAPIPESPEAQEEPALEDILEPDIEAVEEPIQEPTAPEPATEPIEEITEPIEADTEADQPAAESETENQTAQEPSAAPVATNETEVSNIE